MRRRRFKLHIPRTVVFYGLLAGLLDVAVAWFSRNVLVTIAAGMAALWLLQLF